ncbi:LysR substrate-binding domain-containing protein [Methylocella sp. CPCC 101449]|jgi:DNA-binding transcriptional LysR family regulator|uniref:LysR family transcriptional regulator n=1 Tax=Methylocella sp. CPCC 101449 TaxID=2987531 RepID=UPI0028905C2D|nr:LysR substrate-binding domain-containing protein [Methylocella sp. CPCC 101449]MDT2020897.1 LysR family transcriptional regulator [Methylocella sp. CPCC 101449]HEV2570849.1 LysR substrate-binding domain-containing protein [Beijerinckiaceae bacterium]
MDIVQNLKAFLAVAQTGSFSAAARQAGLATSVLTKRVDQLEAQTRTKLFLRTTRRLTLTEDGSRWLGQVRTVVADVDELLLEAARPTQDAAGAMRVKVPTTLAVRYLGDMLGRFQRRHPKVTLDIVLTDRALNPAEEGFDLAVSVFPESFSGVVDVPLCALNRTLCASADYLARHGTPQHPRELAKHQILNFYPTGATWRFESATGPVAVDVRPRMSANDGQVLLAAARAGNGIALLPNYLALPALRTGSVAAVLEDFSPPELWVRLLVPERRVLVPRVRALMDFLTESFRSPPWEQIEPNE